MRALETVHRRVAAELRGQERGVQRGDVAERRAGGAAVVAEAQQPLFRPGKLGVLGLLDLYLHAAQIRGGEVGPAAVARLGEGGRRDDPVCRQRGRADGGPAEREAERRQTPIVGCTRHVQQQRRQQGRGRPHDSERCCKPSG